MQSNFAHCANFSACAKIRAICAVREFFCLREIAFFQFLPKTTPFCIFSNFTPDVITIDMGILVFHFFVRLYIAILCIVDQTFLGG